MKRYDFTVVGTAATVSILRVRQMPECGKSTPVFGGGLAEYDNGGMGLNICAGLAKLGASVYPVLTYADYRQHDFLHGFAKEYRMPEDGIKDPPAQARGTTIMIQNAEKNHMTLITEYEHRLPESTFYGVQEMKPQFFRDSRYVILTAPMAMNTQPAIDAIRASGTPLVLSMRKDPNALPKEKLAQLLELSTVIFANETETAYLQETFGLKSACDLFEGGRLQILVETLGAEGSRVYYRSGTRIEITQAGVVAPQCEEPETVGAGDGYVCGFLYGLIRGYDMRACALLGATVSSFVLEKEGSITNLPTEAQLLARYETIRRDD